MVKKIEKIIDSLRSVLFPEFYGGGVSSEMFYAQLLECVPAAEARELTDFVPELKRMLDMDIEAAYNGDPAAESLDEIVCCYPVIKALINYRFAHRMLELGIKMIPRIITELAHSETGIDIHPAATIGHHFTIDHGTGVVIGATCIIGNYVKLYQGVTLGAKSFPLDDHGHPIKGIPRHPGTPESRRSPDTRSQEATGQPSSVTLRAGSGTDGSCSRGSRQRGQLLLQKKGPAGLRRDLFQRSRSGASKVH